MTPYIVLTLALVSLVGALVVLVIVRKGDFAAFLKAPFVSFLIVAREPEKNRIKQR
ncbi:MAG: hypothetical protein ABSD59_11330 [Terracidiphilus sp.]|jgi:hypothetical protein